MQRLIQIWIFLTRHHPRITDEEMQINSRLFSILSVILLPIMGIFLISLTLYFDDALSSFIPDLIIFGTLLVTLSILYVVNRLGYFQTALLSILILGGIALFVESIIDKDLADLAFLILPMIIASLFLPRGYLFFLGAFYIGFPMIFTFFLPENQQSTIFKFVFPILILGIILSIISRAHRDNLESLREKRLFESELRYSLSANAVNDGIWDWDLINNRVYYSDRWKEMIGYQPDEISDSPDEWMSRIHPDDLESVGNQLSPISTVGHNSTFEVEYRFRHKNGEYIWVLSRGRPTYDKSGILIRSVGSHSDITSRRHVEEKLSFDALHDDLTGLANRALFNEKVSQVIKYAKRNSSLVYAVLFLDIDNFKDINDSMGHKAGDEILKQFALRLQSILFDVDTLARLGGDEFVVLLDSLDATQRAIDIVHRIKESLNKPFQIHNSSLYLTASIGVVIGAQEYTSSEEVLRDSDIAMYHAKNLGKNTFEIFNNSMREEIMKRLELEHDLRRGISNQEFTLVYQPIVNLKTSRLLGFEALIRWNHPDRGLIPPGEFIPIAEQTGLIIPIGEWVFKTACEQMRDWEMKFPAVKRLTISINVSGKQLNYKRFYETVDAILKNTNFDPTRINLEITETVILEDNPDTYHTLMSLTQKGMKLQLDDFGKGQSSLGYIQKYSLSDIKIDRSFVSLIHKKREHGLVKGIIQLARALEINTIAEGIELIEQEAILKSLHCDHGQGFGISIPIPAHEIDSLFQKQASASVIFFPVNNHPA